MADHDEILVASRKKTKFHHGGDKLFVTNMKPGVCHERFNAPDAHADPRRPRAWTSPSETLAVRFDRRRTMRSASQRAVTRAIDRARRTHECGSPSRRLKKKPTRADAIDPPRRRLSRAPIRHLSMFSARHPSTHLSTDASTSTRGRTGRIRDGRPRTSRGRRPRRGGRGGARRRAPHGPPRDVRRRCFLTREVRRKVKSKGTSA